MNRRTFLASATVLAAGTGTSTGTSAVANTGASRRKPNIIFILADDLGYGDLGCYGQKRIDTTHIDRLAAEGIRFTDAYAGSTVCAPSRSCLMTGQHTGHTRVRNNGSPLGRISLRPNDVTVAERLKQAGYRTALIGKWGIGEAGSDGTPNRKGFDEWFGYLNQGHAHNYYPEHLWDNEAESFLRGNRGRQRQQYSHDLFMEKALSFIERNQGEPFFLYLALTIPHANNELGRSQGDGMEVPDYAPYETENWPTTEKGFAAMITRMDRGVGQIMAKLKQAGIDEDTLVIFSSDNGPHREGGHDPEFFGSRGGLRGIKRDLYEGGIRVPAIARWPGTIRPGQVSDFPWAFWDFFPTATELAGAKLPDDIDGVSIVPVFQDQTKPRGGYLYWEFGRRVFHQAVRKDHWKAVRNGTKSAVELYDLSKDLGEQNDIAAEHPEMAREMARIMKSGRTESREFPIRERG